VTTPASPRTDQLAKRLKDFRRLREFLDLYARDGALRIAEMPEPDRTEAEEILERIGDLDGERQEGRKKLLADIALVETYLDDLTGKPEHAQEVSRLQCEYRELRAKITGLPANPDNG